MSKIFDTDDSFIDIATVTSSTDTPYHQKKSDFKPWHKPRKQWVRNNQWWFSLEKLLDDNQEQFCDITSLKYFGLPGGDLLDIEYIRQKLESSGSQKNIMIHGFISDHSDHKSAESRLSELLDSPNIDDMSEVEKHNFGTLKNKDSLGWHKIKSMGPYHFINLDFCDCVFKNETLSSIHRLMDFQLKRQLDTPWLLYITTRVDPEGVSQNVLERLDDVLKNLQSDDILESIKACFGAACIAINNNLKLSSPNIQNDALSELLQVCFILWIITYSFEHNTKVQLISSMKYTVNQSNRFPDMLSIVFRFTNIDIPLPDPSELVASPPIISTTSQTSLKCKAITKLSGSLDIDEYLNNEPAEMALCASQKKSLLEKCGWDITNYDRDMCPSMLGD